MDSVTVPQWLWPLLTLLGSAVGAWAAIKVTVAKLEVNTANNTADVKRHERMLGSLNDDVLTHDVEIEQAFDKLQLKRVTRQSRRDWER